jgi:hypothetical protein
LLAYYCPAHTNRIERYGIHIRTAGVAKIVNKIEKALRFRLGREELILLVLLKFYAHEHCHGVIEDLCSLVEFLTGESGSCMDLTYSKVQKRYRSYLLMEEAICNSVAAGCLHEALFAKQDGVLRRWSGAYTTNDTHLQDIENAFHGWMRNQPPGYRDFIVPSGEDPYHDPLIQRNLNMLLIKVYGYKVSNLELGAILRHYFRASAGWLKGSDPLAGLVRGGPPPAYLKDDRIDQKDWAADYDEVEKLYNPVQAGGAGYLTSVGAEAVIQFLERRLAESRDQQQAFANVMGQHLQSGIKTEYMIDRVRRLYRVGAQ